VHEALLAELCLSEICQGPICDSGRVTHYPEVIPVLCPSMDVRLSETTSGELDWKDLRQPNLRCADPLSTMLELRATSLR
jgi:hypothetical protein